MLPKRFIPFILHHRFILAVWGVLLLLACLRAFHAGCAYNNFVIFERSWDHLRAGIDLYAYYPEEYHDHFLYGPLFAVFISPFSIVHEWIGLWSWLIIGTALTYLGIRLLPDLTQRKRIAFMWIVANEVYLALLMQQYNLYVAALMLLGYCAVEKDLPALFALIAVFGLLTKVYGFAVILLFPFIGRKKEAVIWGILFFVALGLLPAVFAAGGLDYLKNQYLSWGETLSDKNGLNLYAGQQNLGLVGMVRKTLGLSPDFDDLWLMVPGAVLLLLPLLRSKEYSSMAFRKLYFAAVALFIVLFSTGTETNTYIIGYIGIALWYLSREGGHSTWEKVLFWGAMVLSFSTSDLMPPFLRYEVLQPFALKALFPSLIWFHIIYTLLTYDFRSDTPDVQAPAGVAEICG